MNNKTKIAALIAAIAAVVSAVILIIVFWDKLLALCPCKKKATEVWEEDAEAEAELKSETEEAAEEAEEEPEQPAYNEEELKDFADLEPAAE